MGLLTYLDLSIICKSSSGLTIFSRKQQTANLASTDTSGRMEVQGESRAPGRTVMDYVRGSLNFGKPMVRFCSRCLSTKGTVSSKVGETLQF